MEYQRTHIELAEAHARGLRVYVALPVIGEYVATRNERALIVSEDIYYAPQKFLTELRRFGA
jgi:hypothetical protein